VVVMGAKQVRKSRIMWGVRYKEVFPYTSIFYIYFFRAPFMAGSVDCLLSRPAYAMKRGLDLNIIKTRNGRPTTSKNICLFSFVVTFEMDGTK